jgi:hypothetical protein
MPFYKMTGIRARVKTWPTALAVRPRHCDAFAIVQSTEFTGPLTRPTEESWSTTSRNWARQTRTLAELANLWRVNLAGYHNRL